LPASPIREAAVGVDGDTAYVLVDPASPRILVVEGDRVAHEIPAPEGATAVRAGSGSLWIPTIDNTVERYTLRTKKLTTLAVGPQPRFLDVGFDAVWVMNQGDGSVTRIDARTGTADAIPVTGQPIGGGDLTVGAGAVW
jgi:streptogramin lyase